MNVGPRPGDEILLANAEGTKEVAVRHRQVLEPLKLRITVESTMEGAVRALIRPFDLVWFRLPLPGLSSNHLLEELSAMHDSASRVENESPANVSARLTPISAEAQWSMALRLRAHRSGTRWGDMAVRVEYDT